MTGYTDKIMDNKIKHLEFIQGIISRMAKNSFALKGWAVTLVAGVFALAVKDADKLFCLIAYVPIIVFWGLDSFYLSLERRYRKLYNEVRLKDEKDIDFDLRLEPLKFKISFSSWLKCIKSKTEVFFYFPLALISTGIILIAYFIC